MKTCVADVILHFNGEIERHLRFRSDEHIGILSLTFKKEKPPKKASIRDHLLQCDKNPSFDEFTILAHRIKKHWLNIRESLFIKRNQLFLILKRLEVSFIPTPPLLPCGFNCYKETNNVSLWQMMSFFLTLTYFK